MTETAAHHQQQAHGFTVLLSYSGMNSNTAGSGYTDHTVPVPSLLPPYTCYANLVTKKLQLARGCEAPPRVVKNQ